MQNETAASVIQPILDGNLGVWAKSMDKPEFQDSPVVQYTKGIWYFYGVGYAQDLDQARQYFEKAAAQGHREAADMLKKSTFEKKS